MVVRLPCLVFTLLSLMGIHGSNILQKEKSLNRKLFSPSEFTPAQGTSFNFVPNAFPPELPSDSPSIPSPPSPYLPPITAPSISPEPSPTHQEKALWCVAKPNAAYDKLQEAMDYACGQIGDDCEEIKPNGSCYFPDNLVDHASFAFNSYWQMMKSIGGTCGFDGAAMIIDNDPSTLRCTYTHT